MSGRVNRQARAAALVFEHRFDDAFAAQRPRWCQAVIYFCEGIPAERILQPYIKRWRERKLADGNARYKRRSLKVLAHKAAAMMRGTPHA